MLFRQENFEKNSFHVSPLFLGDPKKVDYFQNSAGIQNKHSHEPALVIIFYRCPNGIAFPKKRPNCY